MRGLAVKLYTDVWQQYRWGGIFAIEAQPPGVALTSSRKRCTWMLGKTCRSASKPGPCVCAPDMELKALRKSQPGVLGMRAVGVAALTGQAPEDG